MSYEQQEIRELWNTIQDQIEFIDYECKQQNKKNILKRVDIIKTAIIEIEQYEKQEKAK